jgi:type II secretory pathway predicted ATPase ExeA
MYQEHFGLNRPPFKITPDTSLFYEGNKRGAALDALTYAINSGEGIIKVVGEVGSGKTMLCRMLEVRLTDSIDVVYIANPSLSPDNILHVIAHELGLDINNDTSKLDVMQKLQGYLLRKHADNRQVVLFVEEAQSMPVETLEEIRLLSNLETEHSKLLQMVLFGQPELDEKLAQPHIRQLKERITHCFYLDPFTPRDTLEYLNFRLRTVGYRGPDVFNQKTANMVERYSSGLTRRINIIADKSLMASYSEGGHEVAAKHVHAAAIDSDFGKKFNMRPWLMGVGGAAILAIAVWLGTLIPEMQDKYSSQPHVNQINRSQPVVAVAAAPAVDDSIVTEEIAAVSAPVEAKPESQQVKEIPLASSATLLEQRLAETEKWLNDVASNHYSIQLFMARIVDDQAVEKFLRNIPEMLDFEKIYIYETVINGRQMYSVLYDDYASRRIARAKLNSLPEELQASHPFLRRVSAFRKSSVRNG